MSTIRLFQRFRFGGLRTTTLCRSIKRTYTPHFEQASAFVPRLSSHEVSPTPTPTPTDVAAQQKLRLMRKFGWTEEEFDEHVFEDEQFMEVLVLNDCALLASRLYGISEHELDESIFDAKHVVFNEAYRLQPDACEEILKRIEEGKNGVEFWWTNPRRPTSSLEERHPLLAMKAVIRSAQQHVRVAMAYWDNVRDGIVCDISEKIATNENVTFDIRVGHEVMNPTYVTNQRREDGSLIKEYDYARRRDMPLKSTTTVQSELRRLGRDYGDRIRIRGFPGKDAGIGHWKYVSVDSKYTVIGSYNDTEKARDRNNENAVSIAGQFEHFDEGFASL